MNLPDPIDLAAKQVADQLEGLAPAARAGFRYLWAVVAYRERLLELAAIEHRPDGSWEVYVEPASGKTYAVCRPDAWTGEELERYVAEMRLHLLGPEGC